MKIINLGILAHVDAGKTTLTEQMLVKSGIKKTAGRVDEGTATTDSMALEKSRGMTIRASTVSFEHNGTKINLIDTPGHMEFIAEVERSLSVLSGAVLVVSAREGVQSQTRAIYAKLKEMDIPTIIFINKIDRVGASAERTLCQIREILKCRALLMTEDGGLAERAAGESEALLNRYLNDEIIAEETLYTELQKEMSLGLCPAFIGSALKGEGIPPLMDAMVRLFKGDGDMNAPLSALAYKCEWVDEKHKRIYLRVFSGVLRVRQEIAVAGHEAPVRIRTLSTPRNGALVPADAVPAGDIAVLFAVAEVRTGDFVGERIPLPGFRNEQPLLVVALNALTSEMRPPLIRAMKQLDEEDPSLKFTLNESTGEMSIRLFGSLQREILESLIRERFSLGVAFSKLSTVYTDHPTQAADAHMWFSDPENLNEAGIELTVEPLETGAGIAYESRVSLGDLTKSFQTAVEDGVLRALNEGLGYEIVDARVIFTQMQFSSVTSTPADFRRLAPLVLKKALKKAALIRMEPWVTFSATVPQEAQKKMLLMIGKSRAIMQDVDYSGVACTAKGEAPLNDMKDFAAEIAMLSRGDGVAEVRFLEYRKAADPTL